MLFPNTWVPKAASGLLTEHSGLVEEGTAVLAGGGFLGRAGGHGVADSDDESVPKTGQNRRTSRPHLALRGTTWHKPPPTYTRVHARSKDLWDRHVVHPGPDVVTDAGLRVEEVRGSLDQVGVYVVVVPVDWESRRGLRHQRGSTVSDGSCHVQISAVAMTTENVTNRTVKAPLKTGQNAAPGGISRPQLALRGTSLEH